MSGITVERLRELLSYDPGSGVFRWRSAGRGRPHRKGLVAGSYLNKGYRRISIDGQVYLAHRLAWFYVYGSWPDREIDHKNRIRDDNRITNLRDASDSETTRNSKMRVTNTSGLKGAQWHPGARRWQARIGVNRRSVYLGLFDTREEAHVAYVMAAIEYHGAFAWLPDQVPGDPKQSLPIFA